MGIQLGLSSLYYVMLVSCTTLQLSSPGDPL